VSRALKVEKELRDLDVLPWVWQEGEADDGPTGAAAALAVVAFMGFVIGLAVAALILL
jgi:hypothetical protein